MFTFGGKASSRIKPKAPEFHTERQATPVASTPLASHPKSTARQSQTPSNGYRKPAPPLRTPTQERLAPPKRKAVRQASPSKPGIHFDSDSEDDFSSPAPDAVEKRVRRGSLDHAEIASRKAFRPFADSSVKLLHAADIKWPVKKLKLSGAGAVSREAITVEVQYPGASLRERYNLVFAKDQINPADEICEIANIVAKVYLRDMEGNPLGNEQEGVLRKLERARNLLCKDDYSKVDERFLAEFKSAVDDYNSKLDELIKNSVLAKNLSSNRIHKGMVAFIVKQVYHRVVSPQVDKIHSKVEDKNNTYGELEPSFVSTIIRETKLKEDDTFIDFGSGVGNVVLQMALEAGCRSWGCEMREVSCDAAEEQKEEFKARCRLWGLRAGSVHLERGDFTENANIKKEMGQADVILVNNEVFGSNLNERLRHTFLDLKDGCRVVSLKSFGTSNEKRNENDVFSQFVIEEKEYFAGDVSWKGQGGTYFIATKDPTGRLAKRMNR
ncbi:histone methylation protein DOT1-domain-containing protein [Bisporella sp. PMI_857]|nr:histone methylation protein DOT1-domain-containing protein [Bisporella sp. PMI_857]